MFNRLDFFFQSRSAAVIELVGEDLTTCERTYQNAIYMLCAILDCQDDEEGMDEEDKQILNKRKQIHL